MFTYGLTATGRVVVFNTRAGSKESPLCAIVTATASPKIRDQSLQSQMLPSRLDMTALKGYLVVSTDCELRLLNTTSVQEEGLPLIVSSRLPDCADEGVGGVRTDVVPYSSRPGRVLIAVAFPTSSNAVLLRLVESIVPPPRPPQDMLSWIRIPVVVGVIFLTGLWRMFGMKRNSSKGARIDKRSRHSGRSGLRGEVNKFPDVSGISDTD